MLKRNLLTGITILSFVASVSLLPVLAQDEPLPTESPPVNITPTAEPTPIPRPNPALAVQDGPVTLALYFANLPQGGAGVVHLYGDGITSARARFLNNLVSFFQADSGDFFAVLPVNIDVTPRDYTLSASVQLEDGTRTALDAPVTVTTGGFVRQAFTIPGERAYLTAPEIERNEYARLQSVFNRSSEARLWSDVGFRPPLASEITSPFGAYRTLNEATQTRHTGWDFRAPPGTPVQASADGEVVFAGAMDIRGNHIIIDHGLSVFSGYSHLSQVLVTPQQSVSAGQIIGMTGNTGRSNGPHLHWEISVGGQWVDSLALTDMWLP